MLCTCASIPPPTQRSRILVVIQKALMIISLLYGLFLLLSRRDLGLLQISSAMVLFYAYTQISFFSSFVVVIIHFVGLWWLNHDLIVRYQN